MQDLELNSKEFVLATIHRAENTDDPDRLVNIMEALNEIAVEIPVILPLHPRTLKKLEGLNSLRFTIRDSRITFIDPLGYLDMVMLEKNSRVIITDSGGVQKEAYFHRVPCVTVRDETEWVELVVVGANLVAGTEKKLVIEAYQKMKDKKIDVKRFYGDGDSARKIIKSICKH